MNSTESSEEVLLKKIQDIKCQYFNESKQKIHLSKGDILFKQGDDNNKLYHVIEGSLSGFQNEEEGSHIEYNLFVKNDFIGIRSFFDEEIKAYNTVQAESDCQLRSITFNEFKAQSPEEFEKTILTLSSYALMKRQQNMCRLLHQEKEIQSKLNEMDRLSCLGQFSAGVAHELNNALSVIIQGSQWLSNAMLFQISQLPDSFSHRLFETAIRKGHSKKTKDIRSEAKQIVEKYGLEGADAKKIATMEVESKYVDSLVKNTSKELDNYLNLWEIGATFKDVVTSSAHAGHVITSMKNLGSQNKNKDDVIEVNQSLQTALSILRVQLQPIGVKYTEQNKLIYIRGNQGELVQVWVNILKNACDVLLQNHIESPLIDIKIEVENKSLFLVIEDNGPGIPENLLEKIFLPNFTTKKANLNFGLGLGLSIVNQIVTSYAGTVQATNSKNGAIFTIQIPLLKQEVL